jgi:hypothetical protein
MTMRQPVPAGFRRIVRLFAVGAAGLAVAGCNHSPSQDILGSFFPAWMLCAVAGLLSTLGVRQILLRTGVDRFVPLKLIVYFGLAVSLTFICWLIWFSN